MRARERGCVSPCASWSTLAWICVPAFFSFISFLYLARLAKAWNSWAGNKKGSAWNARGCQTGSLKKRGRAMVWNNWFQSKVDQRRDHLGPGLATAAWTGQPVAMKRVLMACVCECCCLFHWFHRTIWTEVLILAVVSQWEIWVAGGLWALKSAKHKQRPFLVKALLLKMASWPLPVQGCHTHIHFVYPIQKFKWMRSRSNKSRFSKGSHSQATSQTLSSANQSIGH